MKKFIALVVMLCAVLISSSASAATDEIADTVDSQGRDVPSHWKYANNKVGITPRPMHAVPASELDRLTRSKEIEKEEAAKKAEEERLKKEQEIVDTVDSILRSLSLLGVIVFSCVLLKKAGKHLMENPLPTWAFIFCFVSLVTCIFYVPYNVINPKNPNLVYATTYATIFESPPRTRIDYQAIAFRELLILLGCCAGYTASNIIKKK